MPYLLIRHHGCVLVYSYLYPVKELGQGIQNDSLLHGRVIWIGFGVSLISI